MVVDFDDKDLAIVGLVVVFVTTVCVLATVPKELLKDIIQAFAPVWTAIVGALGGIATGRNKGG